MQTLVLGLGNTILTDDGIGVYVVREVAARWAGAGVEFQEACVGGLRLLEVIAGYDRLILVDAIQTPNGAPGQIYRLAALTPDPSPEAHFLRERGEVRTTLHAGSTHDLSFQGALAWGRRMGMALPADDAITLIAIEADDVLTFGEALTPAVAAAVPDAVDTILGELAAR